MKTQKQIEKKFKKVIKKMDELNNPDLYNDRKPTRSEMLDLGEAIGEWKAIRWIRGK